MIPAYFTICGCHHLPLIFSTWSLQGACCLGFPRLFNYRFSPHVHPPPSRFFCASEFYARNNMYSHRNGFGFLIPRSFSLFPYFIVHSSQFFIVYSINIFAQFLTATFLHKDIFCPQKYCSFASFSVSHFYRTPHAAACARHVSLRSADFLNRHGALRCGTCRIAPGVGVGWLFNDCIFFSRDPPFCKSFFNPSLISKPKCIWLQKVPRRKWSAIPDADVLSLIPAVYSDDTTTESKN